LYDLLLQLTRTRRDPAPRTCVSIISFSEVTLSLVARDSFFFGFLSTCSIVHVLIDNEREKEREMGIRYVFVCEREGHEISLLLLHRMHVN
jgi:hypothetical protein